MKPETKLSKLNALLGIPEEKVAEIKTKSTGKVIGITEDQIQHFRELQGLVYFLQAPKLFTPKQCKHCGEHFLVSRKYVALCSYTCIKKSLEEIGITWTKDNDIEVLVDKVYEGNEPLWIREPILSKLKEVLGNESLPITQSLSQTPKSPSDTIGSTKPTQDIPPPLSSPPSQTTRPSQPTRKLSPSRARSVRRISPA